MGNKNKAKRLDDSEEKTHFVTIAVGKGAGGGRGVADGRKNGEVEPVADAEQRMG